MQALIVIPAYNESRRLPRLVSEIEACLRSSAPAGCGFTVRFVVVDDGSRLEEYRATDQLVRASAAADRIRLIRCEENRGKGAAIRTGVERGLAEQFDYVGFMDADGAVPVREMYRALGYLQQASAAGVVGVIGSRVQILGRAVVRAPLRHYLGRLFATFVSLYFGHAVYDTQCGLKIFERTALARYLHVPDDTRWVWDTELLLAMLHGGEKIHEMPIDWRETGDSKVSLVRDPLAMTWRLVRFRRRLRKLRRTAQESV